MKRLTLISCLATALLAACSIDVDYCSAPHPHQARVAFNYNWALSHADVPAEMYVVAIRLVNETHYVFRTTSRPSGNTGKVLWPIGPTDSIYFTTIDSLHDIMYLRGGEYSLLAFNREGIDYSLSDWGELNSHNVADALISDSVCNDVDSLDLAFHNWRDRNPYSGYLKGGHKMHVYSAISSLAIPLQVTGNPLYTCTFTPKPLTQRVNINFTIVPKERDIVVDRITCGMSGACRSIRMMTGEVLTDRTYKVLYQPRFSQTAAHVSRYEVRGDILVPGIVQSSAPQLRTGPGILQVNVELHYTDGKGQTHYRTLEAGINLFKTLSNTPSLQWNESTGIATQTRPEITLNIEDVMQLTHDKIESIADVNMDKWIDCTATSIDF